MLPAGRLPETRTSSVRRIPAWPPNALRCARYTSSVHSCKPLTLSVLPCARVTQNRSADTEAAGSSYASGFIVDAQRGLILTNRHVVTPGTSVSCKASVDHPCQPSVSLTLGLFTTFNQVGLCT